MKICTKCFKDIQDDAVVCAHCGEQQPERAKPEVTAGGRFPAANVEELMPAAGRVRMTIGDGFRIGIGLSLWGVVVCFILLVLSIAMGKHVFFDAAG